MLCTSCVTCRRLVVDVTSSTVRRCVELVCLHDRAAQTQHGAEMAALSSPLRVCRGILKELRAIQGPSYKQSLAYNYVMDQFRKNEASFSLTACQTGGS